jgi:hypothetical protein
MAENRIITLEQRKLADIQLRDLQRSVIYDTKDFPVELILKKFRNGDFFAPDYQRNFIWTDKNKSLFI